MRPALLCSPLLAVLLAGAVHAQSAKQTAPGKYALNTIKKATPYAIARGDMLEAGNVPDYHGSPQAKECSSADAICRAYPELDTCAGTGTNPCRFGWTAKEGGHYFIVTQGEVVGGIAVTTVIRE